VIVALAAAHVIDENGFVVPESRVSANRRDIIDYVNANANWQAAESKFFDGMTLQDAKKLMGTVVVDPKTRPGVVVVDKVAATIPTSFDSRTQWPGCIGAIRNQARCGSCWAFGAAESASDRTCIQSSGSVNVTLAPLDLVECDNTDDGCEGGEPLTALQYWVSSGLVTEQCMPYNDSIPTCPPQDQPCLNFVNTPPCNRSCANGADWKSDKVYGKNAYAVSSKVAAIQTEMMTNGPVEVAFNVYEDFLSYKSGVYQHTSGAYVGGHAVKMIGWGVLNGEDYWLCSNSWTTYWGDDGFFLILRGVNECGIESGVCAAMADVSV